MESRAQITLYSIRLWLHVTLTFSTIRLHGDQRIPTLWLCCPILRTQRRHIAVRVGGRQCWWRKGGREERKEGFMIEVERGRMERGLSRRGGGGGGGGGGRKDYSPCR